MYFVNVIHEISDTYVSIVSTCIEKRKERVLNSSSSKIKNIGPLFQPYRFTKFRTSSHRLRIETGRWLRIEVAQWLGQCEFEVQTETCFVWVWPCWTESIKTDYKYQRKVQKECPIKISIGRSLELEEFVKRAILRLLHL